MPNKAKVALWTPVVAVAVVVALTLSGVAAPTLTWSTLPVEPPVAILGTFGLVFAAAIGTGFIDRWAWTQAAKGVGLSTDGLTLLGPPDVSGTVAGQTVRAWTHSTGGGEGSSSKTYTIVETDLQRPVEWWGLLAAADDEQAAEDDRVQGMSQYTVDGEMTVAGEIPEEVARELLTPSVRSSLEAVDGGVTIGDVEQQLVGAMQAELEDAEGLGGTLAKGMLSAASDGEPAGPSETVKHRAGGIVDDEAVLQRRIDAVLAVAAAVDRQSTR